MVSRLAPWTLLAAAFAQPCFAQKVVSTHPPLSPQDAVNVLRSSHSLSDMANRPAIDPDGPRIYILPDDRSIDLPPMMPSAPIDDGIPLFPYAGYGSMGVPWYGGIGMPYGAFLGRTHIRGSSRAHSPANARQPTPAVPAPAHPARSIVVGAPRSGGARK